MQGPAPKELPQALIIATAFISTMGMEVFILGHHEHHINLTPPNLGSNGHLCQLLTKLREAKPKL